MIGCRRKDRVKVNGIDTKIFQVIQLFINTHQVAALETIWGGVAIPALKVSWFKDLVAPGETIGENLVEHRVFDPVWSNVIVIAHSFLKPLFSQNVNLVNASTNLSQCIE